MVKTVSCTKEEAIRLVLNELEAVKEQGRKMSWDGIGAISKVERGRCKTEAKKYYHTLEGMRRVLAVMRRIDDKPKVEKPKSTGKEVSNVRDSRMR